MSVIKIANEPPAHVQLQLGVYVLGALPAAEADAVERHLDVCVTCVELAIELTEARDALSRLAPPERAAAARPALQDRRLESGRPGRSPGTPRTAAGPAQTRRRPGRDRRRLGLLAGLAATILIVGAGLALPLLFQPSTDVALASIETGPQAGVRMTVTGRQSARGCRLNVSISGLKPQDSYQLHVVEANGSDQVVSEFIALGPDQQFPVDVAIPARNVALVSVTTADGRALVSVRLTTVPG